jgi:acyl dehydratase
MKSVSGWVERKVSSRAALSTNYKGSLAGSHFFAHLRWLRLVFTPDELSF